MSTWRLAVRALYQLGGSATFEQIACIEPSLSSGRVHEMRRFGLVTSDWQGSRNSSAATTYTLTKLGLDWCEGRVEEVRGPHPRDLIAYENRGRHRGAKRPRGPRGRGIWFIATWLSSLPKDIRIAQVHDKQSA